MARGRKRIRSGIPAVTVSFGAKLADAREPLHRRLGIETTVYRIAILDDHRIGRRFDSVSRAWNHQHLYRESITLPRV